MESLPPTPLVSSAEGLVAVLLLVTAFFFWLERRTRWRIFELFPPLMYIYAVPVALNNLNVIPRTSAVYDVIGQFGLPMFLCLLLLRVDLVSTTRIMGRGVLVMLCGTAGVVVGGPVAFLVVHGWLSPDAWKGYGTLAASWIGGLSNMTAMKEGLGTPPDQFGLAVITDSLVYVAWLPIMLGSKVVADRFNRWAKVDPKRLERIDSASAAIRRDGRPPTMVDHLYLALLAVGVTWISTLLAPLLPVYDPVLTVAMWRVLLITTFSLALSFTPARNIPGSHEVAMAIMYVFIAVIGAQASLAGLAQAPAFLLGGFLWIAVHGAFCLAGAWLFRVDMSSVAIASAANIGATASAPVVAAAHRESLVPASILLALLGNAYGTYFAVITAELCRRIAMGT